MDRRGFLRGLALAVAASAGCLSNPPRPTGPRRPPSSPEGRSRDKPSADVFRIETFDFEESDDGDLRVFGTVTNAGQTERTGTITVTATVDGEKHTKSTEVTVPSGETREFDVEFDIDYQQFSENGSLDVSISS